jgi:mannose-6-phosphate isomerase-like protein (cupin superfamily)
MPKFDLETTYLSLDGQGRVAAHPVDDQFWATVETNTDLLANLVGVYPGDADWPHWEMHPDGEEILVLLDGRMTMILDEAGVERRVELAPGSTLVVPRGVWHRALMSEPSRLLAITYGQGTQHRPA